MKRVAELEKALESESAKFKRKLDEAEQREIELMQAEKVKVSCLLSLAAHVGGKRFSPPYPFCCFFVSILRVKLVLFFM